MSGLREEMACATCLAPLNVVDGDYIHPLHRGHDGHPPVPVPAGQLDTVHRICDFCGDPHPIWALHGGPVAILASTRRNDLWQNLGQTWAACVPCMADITAARADRVVDRAVQRMGAHGIPAVHAEIGTLHQAFLDGRRPGRALLTTTAWPDLNLSPRDLPKVRDRLAAFYRGPDQLPTTLHINHKRSQLAGSLDRARLYWVDNSFTDLAEHAAWQLKAVTVGTDLMPGDDGLLVWSRAATNRKITGASWSTCDEVIHVVIYRAIGAGLDDPPMQRLRGDVGWLAPMRTFQLRHDQLADDEHHHGCAILLATWLLIAQKAAQTIPAPVDKTVRKRYARDQRPLPDVRIVRIRPHATHEDTPSSTVTSTGRTYTSRVWVTGHWRNQPYGPGRTLRRPVYIHPFLRGPQDAPVKLNTTVRILDNHAASHPHSDTH